MVTFLLVISLLVMVGMIMFIAYRLQVRLFSWRGSKRTPTNTTTETLGKPFGLLLGVNMSEMIPQQEKEGQTSFVESDTLPSHRNDYSDSNSQLILESAGVKFGPHVPGDPMFQYVILPAGWKKVPTDHSMWSNLVDEKGRKRASIFYKAAFYDRNAHYSANRRFSFQRDYDRHDRDKVAVCNIYDGDTVIHTTDPIEAADPNDRSKDYDLMRAADAAAIFWLDQHFPMWKDAGSYWN